RRLSLQLSGSQRRRGRLADDRHGLPGDPARRRGGRAPGDHRLAAALSHAGWRLSAAQHLSLRDRLAVTQLGRWQCWASRFRRLMAKQSPVDDLLEKWSAVQVLESGGGRGFEPRYRIPGGGFQVHIVSRFQGTKLRLEFREASDPRNLAILQ